MIVTARVLFQAATQQRSSRVSLKNLEEQLSESGMAGELAGWLAGRLETRRCLRLTRNRSGNRARASPASQRRGEAQHSELSTHRLTD